MGHGMHVQELPGVGKRYDFDAGAHGERLSVVVRHDGIRDLYTFDGKSEDPAAVIKLSEDRARKVAAVLAGTFFES